MGIYVKVGGMSEGVYGLQTVETLLTEKAGNYTVLFSRGWCPKKVKDLIFFCQKHQFQFVMDETWRRLQGVVREEYGGERGKEIHLMLKQAGAVYDGVLFMCEYGGLTLYWPLSTVKESKNVIPKTNSLMLAKENLVSQLRKLIQEAVREGLPRPLVSIEAGGLSRYLYEAGIDRVDLEMTYHAYTEWLYATAKGAARAYLKPTFGVDMAMVWYGGNHHDDLWFHRWKTSLYQAFLRGADPIYAEHGLMDYKALGKDYSKSAPEVRKFRKILKDFYTFTNQHARPSGFPKARVAVIQGHLDSFSLGEKFVWGQRHTGATRAGDAEDSWELYLDLYQQRPWQFPHAHGDQDLSGNPPCGQVDVIPAESSLELMQQYDGLIFLGWNTMTNSLYRKLSSYVKSGGQLLCTLAHLDTRDQRTGPLKLFRNGDLTELFGVKLSQPDGFTDKGIKFLKNPPNGAYQFPLWTSACDPKYDAGGFPTATLKTTTAEVLAGFSDRFLDEQGTISKQPVLTVNRHGKGQAFLINATVFPAHRGLRPFFSEVLDFFTTAHQRDPLVETSSSVRFAIYEEGDLFIIYLLNTDAACSHEARVSVGKNRKITARIPAGKLVAVYANDRSLVISANPRVIRISRLSLSKNILAIHTLIPPTRPPNLKCFVDGDRWKGEVNIS